jgi:hypothetical protein
MKKRVNYAQSTATTGDPVDVKNYVLVKLERDLPEVLFKLESPSRALPEAGAGVS